MQWTVRDAMTADVVTVTGDAAPADIITTMTTYDVSAVAVIDEYDRVLGIITRTDVLNAVAFPTPQPRPRIPWRRIVPAPDWITTSAREMMRAPALTVAADATLAQTGRLMRRHRVNRLLVTGPDRRLLGIVTAGDLLKVHDRRDEAIRDDVRQVLETLPLRHLHLDVRGGAVTVIATVGDARHATLLPRLVRDVPGVTLVRDEITVDQPHEPAVVQASPAPSIDGWWPGRHPQRRDPAAAAAAA
jgi:CBS domain-containing protein